MRRDHFTLAVANTDSETSVPPTLVVTYDGPPGTMTARLRNDEGHLPDGEDVDVAFRLQAPLEDDETRGVFSVTRRLTGEYLLEVNAGAADVLGLVDAAREADGDYTVRIERPDGDDLALHKETLLVYDDDGSLLRQHSLIPGGVEL
jgi:hypothetical protein